jgi:ABC-2 type transport system ATP-binding protein
MATEEEAVVTSRANAVEVADLVVRYGRETVIEGVALEVPAGSVFALLGRNGAGKSSLLRVVLGLSRAEAGSALLLGEDVWSHRAELMERVGVAPERPWIEPERSSLGAARLMARLRRRFDLEGFRSSLREYAIDGRVPFGQLSRGQQSLVSLALAMATRAELLVLDDPTLGLDAVTRRAVYVELIDALADWAPTVLIATHDIAGIETLATHAGILDRGRMVVAGEVEALREGFGRVLVGPEQAADLASRARVWRRSDLAWGVELVLETERWEELGVTAKREPLRLEEICLAVAGKENEEPSTTAMPRLVIANGG